MAEGKSSVIGLPSGRIGNVIVRIRNGKPFYYSVPVNFKISKSKESNRARSDFASTVNLAKTANAVPKLKEIWKNADVPGTNSYQKLIKNNAKRVRDGLLTTSNKITPEGLPLKLKSAGIENEKLILSFDCPVSPDLTFPSTLFIFLYFGGESGAIFPLFKEIPEAAPDGTYNIEASLDPQVKRLLSEDNSPIVYIALAGGTVFEKKVYWTSTGAVKI